jgi:hypothetical protein
MAEIITSRLIKSPGEGDSILFVLLILLLKNGRDTVAIERPGKCSR